ncbi:MAG: 5,10-methylenetetrahydromethanopterin reductase [Acidimicrobiia bacterium]|jgi:5,10-methylenetetrahydromethanopterin reductase|nr:5,10-methylenetetrahydromethanopterin reductase [Acidimicrobiia bacterium]
MPLTVSCAFATSMATPRYVELAEHLGYERAWLYDSPALYPDVWATLVRCAERTNHIGLGPGVLVPSLRHPMVNAAAIAMLAELAGPTRVAVAVGSGFTGRYALGQKPMRWSAVADYVRCLRSLLAGETVTWEGGKMRMMHPAGFAEPRPLAVPFLLGAAGPRGLAAAREVGDGVFLSAPRPVPDMPWQAVMMTGTVLERGEAPDSERVVAAAGHGAAVAYHFLQQTGRSADRLPGGEAWRRAYDDVPEDERHLALHDLHLIAVNERDRPFITGDVVAALGAAFTPEDLRSRLQKLEEAGATEIAYQPAGPDVPRELEAFISAARA